MDGDTILDKDFVKYIEPHFEDKKTVAVAGYVTSIKNNWLTACREIDYTFGQNIHRFLRKTKYGKQQDY
jgi:cellulose synthase/poly-beta-1,6-N-acetylglucosamine synthase-like glycosyltransferase